MGLFSALRSIVLLYWSIYVLCHLAWWATIVASTPCPSSSPCNWTVLGSFPSSSNLTKFAAIVVYPLPGSRRLYSTGQTSDSVVSSWHTRHSFQFVSGGVVGVRCSKVSTNWNFFALAAVLTTRLWCQVEYLDKQSNVMGGPRKIRSRGSWSHIVSKATDAAGKMTGYCVFEWKNRSEKGFQMHKSLQNYIERMYGRFA